MNIDAGLKYEAHKIQPDMDFAKMYLIIVALS